jgi:hypothetical protein
MYLHRVEADVAGVPGGLCVRLDDASDVGALNSRSMLMDSALGWTDGGRGGTSFDCEFATEPA